MIVIDNQPINFNICDLCQCLGEECQVPSQLARYQDKFSFQVTDIDYFLSEELLVSGSDWYGDFENGALAPNWANDASVGSTAWTINAVAPLAGTYDVKTQQNSQRLKNLIAIGATSGNWYQLDFLHTTLSSNCQLRLYTSVDGVSWTIETTFTSDSQVPYTFQASSSFNFIGFALILNVSCEGDWFMDNISLKEYQFNFTVNNCCDGNWVANLDVSKFSIVNEFIVFEDKWSDYVSSVGYYKICRPNLDLIKNPSFTYALTDWDQDGTGSASFVWNSGRAEVTLGALEVSELISQSPGLPDCTYSLVVDIEGVGADFEVYINGELFTTLTDSTGSTTIELDIDDIVSTVGFKFTDGGAGGTYAINSAEIVVDICSDCVKLDEDFDCSLLLTATQTNDAFDLDFTDHTMYMRVYADIGKGTPEFAREISKSSSALFSRIYSDYNNLRELKVYLMPSYMWGALSVMSSLRTFKINGVSYTFKEGNWELDWDERREFASAILDIYKSQQTGVNAY